MTEPSPRQVAFIKLSKLYNDLIMKTPAVMTTDEQAQVAHLLSHEFNKIFDEYDRAIRARKRL